MKRPEAGMVTAEIATIAPFGMIFASLLIWLVSLGVSQVQIAGAAREAARSVARGEPISDVINFAEAQAPKGARVRIWQESGHATIRVQLEAGFPLLPRVGAKTLLAESVVALENSDG